MKIKRLKMLAASLAFLGASLCSSSVFAVNPYNINYTGGTQLGASNVQINPELVNGLTPLIKGSSSTYSFSNSTKWKDGYYKTGGNTCVPVKYFEVSNNSLISESDGLSLSLSQNQYTVVINLKKVSLEGVTDNSKNVPMFFPKGTISLFGSWATYQDAECSVATGNQLNLHGSNGERLFAEMDIKLYRNDSESVFTANDLYFGITDIDAAQSYRILNSGNELSLSNMFAKKAEELQPTDSTLRNMYVESANGNYIYSEYDENGGMSIPDTSNIYVKLNKNTQQDGLDVVFGYTGGAASGIQFFAKQYTVSYSSDKNGDISGIDEEQIISGSYPSGSKTTPNEDYELLSWIADVDVTLEDGTVIKAGDPILDEEIKEVIVDQDITFTAIHVAKESSIVVPNTGAPTGSINAILVPASIIGVLLGALFIRSLPRLASKKIKFEEKDIY